MIAVLLGMIGMASVLPAGAKCWAPWPDPCCTMTADIDKDGFISLSESVDIINRWSSGEATLDEVIQAINHWSNPISVDVVAEEFDCTCGAGGNDFDVEVIANPDCGLSHAFVEVEARATAGDVLPYSEILGIAKVSGYTDNNGEFRCTFNYKPLSECCSQSPYPLSISIDVTVTKEDSQGVEHSARGSTSIHTFCPATSPFAP